MPTEPFDISVIIVSWNTKEMTRQCLNSIMRTSQHLRTEVIVVDNGSEDGTSAMIDKEFPDVVLIESKENLGFAKANNTAMLYANGRYLCFVNSDVIVLPNCFSSMFEFMEANPAVGIIGPKMLDVGGAPGPSCMRRPSLWLCTAQAIGLHRLFSNLKLHMDNYDSHCPEEVNVLNGWFWMARLTTLRVVGPLDEQFFMYGEDIDWCTRFWERGSKVVYFPVASSIHISGGSSARDPIRFYVELQRSRLRYWQRHYGKVSQFLCRLILTIHQGIRIVGHGAVYILVPDQRQAARQKLMASAACLRSLARTWAHQL